MAVWRRYLMRDLSGRLVELPSRVFDRADDGTQPLPRFAGRCVDLVSAVLVGNRACDAQLTEVAFTKLYFDASGFVDATKRDRMIRLLLESCVAAAWRSGAARLELAREFGWKPAAAEVNEVMLRLDDTRWGSPRTIH